MKLSDIAIDRPVFTTMVTVALMVMGALGFSRLGLDLFPNVSFPVVAIATTYPGAGPEAVESDVTRPIEESVSSINGVDEVRSTSRDGLSTVIVMFKDSADVRQAVSDVRDRIAAARATMPADVHDPMITRVDPSAIPVITYAVASPQSPLITRQYVDDVIRPALERVDGVGSVIVSGGGRREIQVELNRERLEALGVTIAQVAQTIRGESYDLPGGRLVVGVREVGLRSVGRFRSPREVGNVVLLARDDGTQVRVSDVGHVIDGTHEERTFTRVNGVDAVTFAVQKQGGTNTVAIVDAVEASLREMAGHYPPGMRVTRVFDSSTFVRNNVKDLKESLVLGGLFAILVIFVFMLDWRSTLISAVALPTSVTVTFFVMWLLGYSLNIMTMMALSLAIGLLIDDSVVVRENIFRHMERGADPTTAARKGTSEIALAVIATTLTIVAVFGPVAFTGGMIGSFFRQFGITVSVAVLVSMFVSFTLDPMLSARVTRAVASDHHGQMRRHVVFGPVVRMYEAMDNGYRELLRWALSHRRVVILGAVALFFGSLALTQLIGQEFNSQGDQGEFALNLELAAGTSLAETDRVTRTVEGLVGAEPEVRTVTTTVAPDEVSNTSSLRVRVTPKTERRRSLAEIEESLRARIARVPGLNFNMREADLGGGGGGGMSSLQEAPITIIVRGPRYDELGRLAQGVFDVVRQTNGIRDPAISYRPGRMELSLVIDRARAADLGVSYSTVASTVRTASEGDVAATFREGEHESDVRVRLRPEDRASLSALLATAVPAPPGRVIYLHDVVRAVQTTTPATIDRLNRERQVTITANVMGRSLGEVVSDIQARLDHVPHAPGYSFEFAGQAKRMRESFSSLGLALALSILFVYFVLASQFESFLHPLTIMLSLPLAIVGAFVALFLGEQALSMSAMIGIILLMGLVTKNAILLVDYANQARNRGLGTIDALLEAGGARLRPILMTSAAMILGMLPTAISKAEGSEFRAPMSLAVIGGVVTSTLLTLVVVPVMYVWIDRFTLRGRRERRAESVGDKTRGAGARVPVPALSNGAVAVLPDSAT